MFVFDKLQYLDQNMNRLFNSTPALALFAIILPANTLFATQKSETPLKTCDLYKPFPEIYNIHRHNYKDLCLSPLLMFSPIK